MNEKESEGKVTRESAFIADAWVRYSPERELEVLSELAERTKGYQIDWKPAIILAAAYLEKYGIEKLKRHFEGKKILIAARFEKLSLSDVDVFLYGLELVPEKYFTWIDQIWRERRIIIHQKGELPSYAGKRANEKYRPMIEKALKVLKFLKTEGVFVEK
jgi:hypothetical protein